MKTENSIKKYPYRGYYHYQATVADLERINPVSDTIQDQDYTVREIMEKFTLHGETMEEKMGLFNGDDDEVTHDAMDLREVMNMDLVDRDELMESVKLRQQIATEKYREQLEKRSESERIKKEAETAKRIREEKGRFNEEQGEAGATIKKSQKYSPKSEQADD